MPNVEHSFVLYALLLEPGGCLRAHITLFELVEPEKKKDYDSMLESADACGVGLAAVSGDVVESTNYVLKKGCNGYSYRGRGAGKSAMEREAMVVQQVCEWWFLTFDLPLLHYITPRRAPPLHF